MSEEKIKLTARLLAIEFAIRDLTVRLDQATGVTPEQVKARHARWRALLVQKGIPGLDSATSDLAAGEIEDAFAELARLIEDHRKS